LSAEETDQDENNMDEGNNDDIDLDEYMQIWYPDYKLQQTIPLRRTQKKIFFSIGLTFHEYLIDQLGLRTLSERRTHVGWIYHW
jgi:hypothetical protein